MTHQNWIDLLTLWGWFAAVLTFCHVLTVLATRKEKRKDRASRERREGLRRECEESLWLSVLKVRELKNKKGEK